MDSLLDFSAEDLSGRNSTAGIGIIIPSAELLVQLSARLNGFKYSAPRRAPQSPPLRPAFVARSGPSRPIDGARNMQPPAILRRPSLTAVEKFFMALFPILSRLSFFYEAERCTRDRPTYTWASIHALELQESWIAVNWICNIIPEKFKDDLYPMITRYHHACRNFI